MYSPSRSDITSSQPVIALLLPDSAYFAHPDFQSLLATAGKLALQHNFELMLSTLDDNPAQFNHFLAAVDGLVCADHAPALILHAAEQAGIPYTTVRTPDAMQPALQNVIAAISAPIME